MACWVAFTAVRLGADGSCPVCHWPCSCLFWAVEILLKPRVLVGAEAQLSQRGQKAATSAHFSSSNTRSSSSSSGGGSSSSGGGSGSMP